MLRDCRLRDAELGPHDRRDGARRQFVISQELAVALGVNYQTIGYLERGEYSPSLHLALRVAEYFEVPVEVVFAVRPFPRLGQNATENENTA